jgi:poly(3-hydroxybutyrate) depolymerase
VPSTGCGNAAAPTGVINGTIDAASLTRTYVLSVPEGYDPNTPIPLVFAWHGRGGNGTLARNYFGIEQQAAGGAIFVYPDGLQVDLGGTGWELQPGNRDLALFDALLAELAATYCIDEDRVFSTGHSFGGYFSNTLGCYRSDVLRAIAPVAGGGPHWPGCSGSVSAWLTHGINDAVVNFTEGENSRNHWLAADGCGSTTAAVSPSPCEAYDGCSAGTAVTWCPHGGGHEWPAFAAGGIWGFFASAP